MDDNGPVGPSLRRPALSTRKGKQKVMLNTDFGEPLDKLCPKCGSAHLIHSVEAQAVRFPYGPGDVLMATVDVQVPVTTCGACGDAWTDARAESVREEAVLQRLAELKA